MGIGSSIFYNPIREARKGPCCADTPSLEGMIEQQASHNKGQKPQDFQPSLEEPLPFDACISLCIKLGEEICTACKQQDFETAQSGFKRLVVQSKNYSIHLALVTMGRYIPPNDGEAAENTIKNALQAIRRSPFFTIMREETIAMQFIVKKIEEIRNNQAFSRVKEMMRPGGTPNHSTYHAKHEP